MKLKQGHVLDVNKVLTQLLAARKKSDKPVHVSLEKLGDYPINVCRQEGNGFYKRWNGAECRGVGAREGWD